MRITRRELLAGAAGAAALPAQTNPAWQSTLAGWKGVRPRLLLTAQKLAAIQAALTTTYADMWKRLPSQTAIIRGKTPPAYSVSGVNDQQDWQRDNGDAMIYLALAYLLTKDAGYLSDCLKWINASCSYPTWGTDGFLNNDLAAGHQLFGLAVVLDWLGDTLDANTAATIRQTLGARAPYMYKAAADPKVYWSSRYLSGQTQVCVAGLAFAGFALFDDSVFGAAALQWIDRARTFEQQTQTVLPPDGSSAEGVTTWDYGLKFGMNYWALAQDLLGEKPTNPYYQLTPLYRIYQTMPYNTWNFQNPVQADLDDSIRGIWYGPSPHMRRLAAMNQIPLAQWYADSMAAKGVDRYLEAWGNFVWYDPGLAGQGPAGLPTLHHFDDLGVVSARSDWSGSESLVIFKCGPPCGKAALKQFKTDNGDLGHAHPDANHFVVFGNGEFQLRDDGYFVLKKTQNHNSLLVNSQGQMGEGGPWFVLQPYLTAPASAGMVTVQAGSSFDYFAGDAAPAYASSLGVRKFTRHLLFLKPSALVIFDDIELNQSSPMELRFHPEHAPADAGAGVYLSQGTNSVLRSAILTPDGVTTTFGVDPIVDTAGTQLQLPYLRLQKTGTSWRNVTAFSWDAKTPQAIGIQPTAAGYTVTSGGRQISFQWDASTPQDIMPIPVLRAAQAVLPAFGGNPAIGFSSNSYVEIYGDNLGDQTATWSGDDFTGSNAPQKLRGTEVRVNGIPAFLYFVSPKQVNVNLPQDATTGLVELQLFRDGIPSNIVTINRAAVSPAMLTTAAFQVNGKQYVAALLPTSGAGGPFVGPPGLINGVPFQTVKPGDRIVLYILGAGPTSPPTQAGTIAATSAKVSSSYSLRIGGQLATVEFFGIVANSIGLYQMNAVVPQVAAGDQTIELTVAGVKDQQGLYLPGITS